LVFVGIAPGNNGGAGGGVDILNLKIKIYKNNK